MNPYLPLPGAISRKRRRHWRRQVLRANPTLNPWWLEARFEISWIFHTSKSYEAVAGEMQEFVDSHTSLG